MIGLLEPRQGEGTVVRDLTPDSLAQPLASILIHNRALLAELLEVRKMFEPPLAARAASLARAEDIARLEEIYARQVTKVGRGEVAIAEDSEFHYAIATTARNRVALKVVDVLMDLLQESRERSLQVPGRMQRSLAGHRLILAAIKRRDPRAAESAMRQHLAEIESVLLKAQPGGGRWDVSSR